MDDDIASARHNVDIRISGQGVLLPPNTSDSGIFNNSSIVVYNVGTSIDLKICIISLPLL